jgi:hypothetical protein
MGQTRFGQADFSGGLNTHPLQAPNELQECTNLFLEDFGAARPAFTDKLLVSKPDMTSMQEVAGHLYYNAGTTLYRSNADGSNEVNIGTIGVGVFKAHKWNDIVIIQASNKFYKVIGTTLSPLGVEAPASATFSLSSTPSPLHTKTIKLCDAGDAFTVSECTVANDAVDFATGANSKKFTLEVPGLVSTALDSTVELDLTNFDGGIASNDNDLITFWVFVTAIDGLDFVKVIFEAGDDQNTFSKIVPVTSFYVQSDTDEDNPTTFADFDRDKINWDEEFNDWAEEFSPETRDEFNKYYTSKSNTLGPITTERKFRKRIPGIEQQWVQIKIPKSEFVRNGDAPAQGWGTITSVKLQFVATIPDVKINIDTIQLEGGGNLDRDRYKISVAYVDRHEFEDGTRYEEVSQLSPEVEITGLFRRDIQIDLVVGESIPPHAELKRFYIRGGGLLDRHEIGDVLVDAIGELLTTTGDEEDMVIAPLEDSRKNGIAPLEATDSLIVQDRLFVLKGKKLSWSRVLRVSAFEPNSNLVLPFEGVSLMEKGANVAVLMENSEVIYVNPGSTATEGGYFYYPENPHGCVASFSAERGYYASYEGIMFFTGAAPILVSHKIRQDYLALTNTSDFVAAYNKGRYFLCSPSDDVMFEWDSNSSRFLKHDNIRYVAAGDNGIIYLIKDDGIYSLEAETQNRKSFVFKTAEVVMPDDTAFRHIVIDANFAEGMDIEYFQNGVAITTITKTSEGRELLHIPINQKAGNRVSVRISSSAVTTNTDKAIFGVYLQ